MELCIQPKVRMNTDGNIEMCLLDRDWQINWSHLIVSKSVQNEIEMIICKYNLEELAQSIAFS